MSCATFRLYSICNKAHPLNNYIFSSVDDAPDRLQNVLGIVVSHRQKTIVAVDIDQTRESRIRHQSFLTKVRLVSGVPLQEQPAAETALVDRGRKWRLEHDNIREQLWGTRGRQRRKSRKWGDGQGGAGRKEASGGTNYRLWEAASRNLLQRAQDAGRCLLEFNVNWENPEKFIWLNAILHYNKITLGFFTNKFKIAKKKELIDH